MHSTRSNLMQTWRCWPGAGLLILSPSLPVMRSGALWTAARCWLEEDDKRCKKWASTHCITRQTAGLMSQLLKWTKVLLTCFCCLRNSCHTPVFYHMPLVSYTKAQSTIVSSVNTKSCLSVLGRCVKAFIPSVSSWCTRSPFLWLNLSRKKYMFRFKKRLEAWIWTLVSWVKDSVS